jgi:hypothetical protein
LTTSNAERFRNRTIRNTDSEPLRTGNFYVPPAHTDEGNKLPTGRKQQQIGAHRFQSQREPRHGGRHG